MFAVRVSTFPLPTARRTFYLGTNAPDDFARLRRDILSKFAQLPRSAEYLNADAFDLAASHGKDMVLLIRLLGTDRLPSLFRFKAMVDRAANAIGLRHALADRIMQFAGQCVPWRLPRRLRAMRRRFDHHLIVEATDAGIAELRTYLESSVKTDRWIECTPVEARIAALHRFAVAGAAVRYRAVQPDRVGDVVSLDIALPRNCEQWLERLPPTLATLIDRRLYYGHFLCHVLHQDYVVARGVDANDVEERLLAIATTRGAKVPAEHNVGRKYSAEPALEHFYRKLDPTNAMNPGVGRLPPGPNYDPSSY